MRAKREERSRAQVLRAQGHSVRSIAASLGVAQSSVSVWVRAIEKPGTTRWLPCVADPALILRTAAFFKRCSRCGRDLPSSAFNRARGGHQAYCRECFRAYFRERGASHVAQSLQAKRRRQQAARRFVAQHLAAHPCVDCGETDLRVLEFDHIGVKRANVSSLCADGATAARIADEIEQCEVRCVNCHRRQSASRAETWRHTLALDDPDRRLRPLVRRNLEFVLSVLRSGCVDCGERDLRVLDFDHVGAKTDTVSRMMWTESSIERIQREIDACEIRCANCHRRVTVARRRQKTER